MKKALITGVTGQDGSLMADFLLRETDHIVVAGIRRLSTPNHINIEHLKGHPRFKLIDLDVTDPHCVERVVQEENPDYFINFAANSFVGNSWKMPINHMETNCMAVLYQLEALRKYAPKCRYYNAGSSEEWGNVSYVPQDEEHPLKPRSPYGASKVAARMLVKVYRESYNMFAIQGWLLNHEGVRRGEEFVTRKISKAVARIKNSLENSKPFEPLRLGNLNAKRDWSDAEDFVAGVWKMLNNDEPKEYVLSSNETHTIKEFVELAFEAAGILGVWVGRDLDELYLLPNAESEYCDFASIKLVEIDPVFFRPAEVDILHGNSEKARFELKWRPKTSFPELVKKMILHDIQDLKNS
jgi:GDPmannose 4,6-dehydratase